MLTAVVLLARMLSAATDDLRVSELSDLATAEFEAGDAASAERDARRLLQMAAANPSEWNHDDMIHAANTILGRAALARGDLKEAKAYLLVSGRVKDSAVLASFGPSMKLAEELVAAGEGAIVLEYLELCRSFWKNDRGRIDRYIELIQNETAPLPDARAPGFRLKDLAGKEWTLDQLWGHVVVLDFWATWCRQCRDELPVLEMLAAELRERGVIILLVNVGEDEATARRFAEDSALTLPVLLAGDDVIPLNYQVHAYPTLVMIDRNGRVTKHLAGAASQTELRQALEKGSPGLE